MGSPAQLLATVRGEAARNSVLVRMTSGPSEIGVRKRIKEL